MSYSLRIGAISTVLAVLTVAAIVFAPRPTDVTVISQAPNGDKITLDSAISITFSRPVDQRSAERAFVLYPPVKGHFIWQGQTLTFRPAEPLHPRTVYRITIQPGLRDRQGYTNRLMTSWPFMTR